LTDANAALTSPTDVAHELAQAIQMVFAVDRITTGLGDGRAIELQGQLLVASAQAYAHIRVQFERYGYTPLLRREKAGITVTAVPGLFAAKASRDSGAIFLFALTVLSVLFSGALMQAPSVSWALTHLLTGLPFALGLLSVLVAHELGHYFAARRLGVATSLPYFIPLPLLNVFGTMGAIIRTREPMHSRRHVLAIGSAGPLAGLLVAVPVLLFGLLRSEVQPIPMQPGVMLEGNSLLYAALKFLVFGRFLPSGGYDVFVHPTAFGAWAALLVTGLNLMPAGQLDGGHVAYALFGQRARWLNRLAVVATVALGLVWSGWFLFALIVLLIGQRHPEPLDDVTPLSAGEKALAIGMLIVFVLLFTPIPMTVL
jgi:membrane-associated protease RseP (regulator of RpoE activity)